MLLEKSWGIGMCIGPSNQIRIEFINLESRLIQMEKEFGLHTSLYWDMDALSVFSFLYMYCKNGDSRGFQAANRTLEGLH